jgi:hypothetical protein
MGGIFISYRRQDSSGHTGRLRDNLRARFGKLVFQDVDGIADGEVFESVLDKALKDCEVALVVIGPAWLTSTDAQGKRRLDDPQDWVRVETRLLLQRGIRVIPVLVGGAQMPQAADLPEDMRPLAKRQCRELRDTAWDADVAALTQRLEEVLKVPAPQLAASKDVSNRWIILGTLAFFAIVFGVWLLLRSPSPTESPTVSGNDPRTGQTPEPIVVASDAIGLPGTWRIERFSGVEDPDATATTYELKAKPGEGVKLVPLDGMDTTMIVKQIKDRAVTLTRPEVNGQPFQYMYVFMLSPDAAKLDNCATIAVADFQNLGPCEWRYHRVAPGAGTKTRADVSCSVQSADDDGCVAAAEKVGLIGTWGTGADGAAYRFVVDGKAVRLSAASASGADARKLAVKSIEGDTLTIATTPFAGSTDFDPQQTYAYDLTDDGSRLVHCRSLMLLSSHTEQSQCTDLPTFLVRAGSGP